MKIAIPIDGNRLSLHFGHCEKFIMFDIDEGSKNIIKEEIVDAPPHEPGLLPEWLGGKGVTMIIAGGMGRRAQDLFSERKIDVVIGASADAPKDIVSAYLNGNLKTGGNICDH
ncbi:MAG: ATPase [Deltaproteobacteria bacterium]|jgi:predicted Fe-Mo cluster-binding NifX family protein|nr:ATPase [Deltaproteobacteria bacterium]